MKKLCFIILLFGIARITFSAECLEQTKKLFTITPYKAWGYNLDVYEFKPILRENKSEDRAECEEFIISTFEKVCKELTVKENDDFGTKGVWVDSFAERYTTIFSSLSIMEHDTESQLRFARALGSIPRPHFEFKDSWLENEYKWYEGCIRSMRKRIIFVCFERHSKIKRRIGDESYNKFVKDFANAAKMTKEECDRAARDHKNLKIRW